MERTLFAIIVGFALVVNWQLHQIAVRLDKVAEHSDKVREHTERALLHVLNGRGR